MKHDPLPWTYELTDSIADDDEDAFVIQSPDGDVAEVCSPSLEVQGNAELIVKAVNCHGELLAALENIVKRAVLVPCKDGGKDAELGEAGSIAAGKWRIESAVDGWIVQARAAIAKAKVS